VIAKRVRNPHGQGTRLREELIAAAGRVLAATPDGTELSLRAVAREAGVAAPSVYLQFADKADLVGAVVGSYFDELRHAITRAMGQETDPVRRLRAGCIAYCTFALDHPGMYRVLFQHNPTDHRSLGDFSSPEDRGARAFTTLVDAIRGCIDSGAAPPGDPFNMARLLWPAMHGYVTLVPVRRGFPWYTLEEQIDALLAAIVGVEYAQSSPGSLIPDLEPPSPARAAATGTTERSRQGGGDNDD
jgi:AcrR family transcriptional regulator